tara:strand:- start:5492 stop:6058 length:567 start_codon:yes stop_codon:yes gene_type:complete
MAIAFPNISIQSMDMRLKRTVSVSESPFSYAQQVFIHPGARWEAEVTLPPLKHDQAKAFQAFLIKLKGQSGTFDFGNPLHNESFSVEVESNGSVRDETLTCSGDAVPAGNYFQVGDRLHIITDDFAGATSPATATLNFQPPLRATVLDGVTLDFTLPTTEWRMTSNDIGWSIDKAGLYSFTFACVEAL